MRSGLNSVGSVGAVCVLSMVMHGCAHQIEANDSQRESGARTAVEARTENTPSSLIDAARFAENVYNYANVNDWKNAAFEVTALGGAIKELRAQIEDESEFKADLYGGALALDRAVTEQNRWLTMRAANDVTFAVMEMTSEYEPKVQSELSKLDYYGRELEVWSEAQDIDRLQATTLQLIREGNRLRRAVDARSAVEGERLGILLTQMQGAETFTDYAQLSKSVRDEVQRLEKLFHQ